jgi:hypothetical protein
VPVAAAAAASATPGSPASPYPGYIPPDPAAQAKAEEILRQKMAELDAQEKAAAAAGMSGPVIPATPPPEKPIKTSTAAVMPVSAAPTVTAGASKEQRLNELLQLYKADRITPYEYHTQRAKIISEP